MGAPPARTVRQIIQKAYQKISVYASGETISADDMNDGLLSFQDMVAEWAGDGMLIPSVQIELVVEESHPRRVLDNVERTSRPCVEVAVGLIPIVNLYVRCVD